MQSELLLFLRADSQKCLLLGSWWGSLGSGETGVPGRVRAGAQVEEGGCQEGKRGPTGALMPAKGGLGECLCVESIAHQPLWLLRISVQVRTRKCSN